MKSPALGYESDYGFREHGRRQIRGSEKRQRDAAELAKSGCWDWDLETGRIIWEPGLNRFLGSSPRRVEGTFNLFIQYIYPADRERVLEALTAARRGKTDFAAEFRIVPPNGEPRWITGFGRVIRDEHGQALRLLGIARDITVHRQAEERLQENHKELLRALQDAQAAHQRAESADRTKDRLLSVLSHELRTPLTPVLLAVNMLEGMAELPPRALKALAMIRRNVELEAQLIDDLLELSGIVEGEVGMDWTNVDVHQAIFRAIEICGNDIRARSQRLVLDLGAVHSIVRGDLERLEQVFYNLLSNASKFTPSGGTIRVRSSNVAERLVVQIIDDGVGIDPEALARIFDAFEHANEAVMKHFGGLGLGLAISKATMDAHGGALRAESDGHLKGATFTVELNTVEPKQFSSLP